MAPTRAGDAAITRADHPQEVVFRGEPAYAKENAGVLAHLTKVDESAVSKHGFPHAHIGDSGMDFKGDSATAHELRQKLASFVKHGPVGGSDVRPPDWLELPTKEGKLWKPDIELRSPHRMAGHHVPESPPRKLPDIEYKIKHPLKQFDYKSLEQWWESVKASFET